MKTNMIGKILLALGLSLTPVVSQADISQTGMLFECWYYKGANPGKKIVFLRAKDQGVATNRAADLFDEQSITYDLVKCKRIRAHSKSITNTIPLGTILPHVKSQVQP